MQCFFLKGKSTALLPIGVFKWELSKLYGPVMEYKAVYISFLPNAM